MPLIASQKMLKMRKKLIRFAAVRGAQTFRR
jgi:hypothetical protein